MIKHKSKYSQQGTNAFQGELVKLQHPLKICLPIWKRTKQFLNFNFMTGCNIIPKQNGRFPSFGPDATGEMEMIFHQSIKYNNQTHLFGPPPHTRVSSFHQLRVEEGIEKMNL